MSRVAPGSSITPIASTGAAFLTGGLVGGAANLILTGGLGQLGGMFGGATAPQQEFGVQICFQFNEPMQALLQL